MRIYAQRTLLWFFVHWISIFAITANVLLSTRIVFSRRTISARDWRVVNVPDDESNSQLCGSILELALDPLEPFVLSEDKHHVPIRVKIRKVGMVHPVTPLKKSLPLAWFFS